MFWDRDLLARLTKLPDHARSDFLEFFGMSGLTKAQIGDIDDTLSASFQMKNRHRSGDSQ